LSSPHFLRKSVRDATTAKSRGGTVISTPSSAAAAKSMTENIMIRILFFNTVSIIRLYDLLHQRVPDDIAAA